MTMRSAGLVLVAAVGLVLPVDAAPAGHEVHFQVGDAGGPEAVLELDPDRVSLALGGCRPDGSSRRLALRLYVAGDAPPDDLDLLREGDRDALSMPLCTGTVCRPLTWRIAEGASGETYAAAVRLVPRSKPSSLRIVLPGEARVYAWHGDLAAVLRRICRVR